MNIYSVFVDGQEGTTGLQIDDYLRNRRDISVLRIDPALRKDPVERARLLNSADVAFLCLPDAAARESAGLIGNPATCVIDTSTAHRVDPDWVYGLPELESGQRERMVASKRITNPGCHATAFILAIRPLVDAGLLPPDYPLSAVSHTGYSGGGKQMIRQYQAARDGQTGSPPALLAPRPYALGLTHKHLPEMTRYARLNRAPVFMPVVGPFYQGLTVSLALDLAHLRALGSRDVSREAIHAALSARYAQEHFVRVAPLAAAPAEGFFDVEGARGTNRADLFVFGHDEQCLVMSRIDNLGKGASGAAIQAMNIHLGLDECEGLPA